jgi:hypothetical protein
MQLNKSIARANASVVATITGKTLNIPAIVPAINNIPTIFAVFFVEINWALSGIPSLSQVLYPLPRFNLGIHLEIPGSSCFEPIDIIRFPAHHLTPSILMSYFIVVI